MNIEIGQDSIFCVFLLIVHIIHLVVCNLSSMSQQYIVRILFFSFCYLSNVSNVLFLFVVVNALFLPIGIDMMYKYLRLNIEFFFVCTKCFFHYARLVENHVSFFSLFVHWSVNCLFFFLLSLFDISHLRIFLCFFLSIVVLAFEYFLSYPYCQIYTKEKCTRLNIK
jgi:hypothetical protein